MSNKLSDTEKVKLVKDALYDLDKGQITLFTFAIIVGSIVNPRKISSADMAWAKQVLDNPARQDGENELRIDANGQGAAYCALHKDDGNKKREPKYCCICGLPPTP